MSSGTAHPPTSQVRTSQVRNVAVLGHGGTGKSSLMEALLFYTGVTNRQGRVEDGSTVSDWDEEEHRRGISMNLSVIPVQIDKKCLNLIDTPGYLDFQGEVISALQVAESGLLLVDAVAGAEVGTELAWERLTRLKKPRIVFVNKMDRENADFRAAVQNLQETLGDENILPFQLPIGEAEDFRGLVNLANMRAYMGSEGTETDIPQEMQEEAEAARVALVEAAAEADDELIVKYFDGEDLTPEEVRRGIFLGVKNGLITPVYCGSVVRAIGMERLMKSVARYTPAPGERTLLATQNGDSIELESDPAGPTAAAVFKTVIDRFVGRINYVRVVSGTLKRDATLANPRTGEPLRAANLFTVCGKELTPTDQLVAGDIGVLTKLDNVITGDTLSAPDKPITVPSASYPRPLFSVAVAPATKADSAKLGQSLHALVEEDPTLRLVQIEATKQTVLQGMGSAHVETALRRLASKYGVNVESSVPKVPYRETITRKGSAQYRHRKQSGGAGQFAEVHMRVEPTERGAGFAYASEVFGGAISGVYLPSIEKGVRQVMEQGVIAGYPVVDVKAVVTDGKEHPVDSKDIAFQTAGRQVFREAVQAAGPVLLEPIYTLDVTVPEEYMGDVMGDLNTRRGRVQGMEQKTNRTVVHAEVPLSEILRYGTDLRSMTQGRGVYTMEFERYDPLPSHLMDGIVKQGHDEEE